MVRCTAAAVTSEDVSYLADILSVDVNDPEIIYLSGAYLILITIMINNRKVIRG